MLNLSDAAAKKQATRVCKLVKGMAQASADALGADTTTARKNGSKTNAESFYEKISCTGFPRGGYGQNLASCIWRYGEVSTSDRLGRSGWRALKGESKVAKGTPIGAGGSFATSEELFL
jgi:hypothetical protein